MPTAEFSALVKKMEPAQGVAHQGLRDALAINVQQIETLASQVADFLRGLRLPGSVPIPPELALAIFGEALADMNN